uniref:Ig-like domain-containing protein n=1 Tax=Cyprinus carpio TaxID=7962 RepID=A0A8C1X130_CYPCA
MTLILHACVSTGSHSLMAFATYIVGQTPFPEFSIVVMLDDLQIAYYDSTTWKVVYRTHSDSKYYDEEQSDTSITIHLLTNLTFMCLLCVHVTQRLVGCELLNDKPGLFKSWDAFDQQNMAEFTFDMEKNKIQNTMKWRITLDQAAQLHMKFIHQNVYHPICIKTLRRYLNIEKNNVMRKVKPRVRLVRKRLPDSHRLQISCLATGFYPRHINLTLFRDGQPVDDDQITGGEILSNGDGTYQMRKSLVISEEDLREEHKYNCTMKHLNLDNKLDITFGKEKLTIFSVLVFICVVVLIITALNKWMKRRAAVYLIFK